MKNCAKSCYLKEVSCGDVKSESAEKSACPPLQNRLFIVKFFLADLTDFK